MATKKTAKKSSESTRPETAKAAAPVATKAVKSATAKKTSAKQAVPKAVPKAAVRPSPDVIARAAYLNYRRRVEQGLPGDSQGDWLEAERYFSITSES